MGADVARGARRRRRRGRHRCCRRRSRRIRRRTRLTPSATEVAVGAFVPSISHVASSPLHPPRPWPLSPSLPTVAAAPPLRSPPSPPLVATTPPSGAAAVHHRPHHFCPRRLRPHRFRPCRHRRRHRYYRCKVAAPRLHRPTIRCVRDGIGKRLEEGGDADGRCRNNAVCTMCYGY